DLLDLIEIPFKGRIVTYPALHYISTGGDELGCSLDEIGRRLKEGGFRYVVAVMRAAPDDWNEETAASIDLILTGQDMAAAGPIDRSAKIRDSLSRLWQSDSQTVNM